jgi:hypothetical protein
MLLNGRAPRPGEIMKFPELASTFKSIVKDGKDGFYKGRIAQVGSFGQFYTLSESSSGGDCRPSQEQRRSYGNGRPCLP